MTPAPARRGGEFHETRDTTQAHVVFATDTIPYRDRRRFALTLITNIFGGGMSSRLFQRIREELGLAYAVYAYQQLFQSTGLAGVYVGTQPAHRGPGGRGASGRSTTGWRGKGSRRPNWRKGKQQLKGQVMLSLENPSSRMARLATIALHDEPLPAAGPDPGRDRQVTDRGGRGACRGVLCPGAGRPS